MEENRKDFLWQQKDSTKCQAQKLEEGVVTIPPEYHYTVSQLLSSKALFVYCTVHTRVLWKVTTKWQHVLYAKWLLLSGTPFYFLFLPATRSACLGF